MGIVLSTILITAGAGLIWRSNSSKPGRVVSGVIGLVSAIVGVIWLLAIVGQKILFGLFWVAGTIAAIGGIAYAVFWFKSSKTKKKTGDPQDRKQYLGKIGYAVTPLRPTGTAEIDGERIDVETEGAFVAAGSSIKVVAMDRKKFFVRLSD